MVTHGFLLIIAWDRSASNPMIAELVSKSQIRFSGKAPVDEKAQHIQDM
jgi:hypothetical protein